MSSMYAAGLQALSSQLTDISNLATGNGKRLVHEGTSIVQRMTAADKIVYGSGFDGALALDGSSAITVQGQSIAPVGGVYTLVADVVATTITFTNSATTLRTAGFVVRCHKLVGDATHVIHDDGNDGTTTGGAALSTAGTLQRSSAAGANGRGTAGTGANGTATTNARGGAGGNGGAAGANAGGTGGSSSGQALTGGRTFSAIGLLTGWLANGASGPGSLALAGGAGGAAGGGSGTGTSGGGGGGGGRCMVFAFECDFAGTIRANGGAGGAASGGNNGGGGGGGGGDVCFMSEYLTRTPTVSANGGSAGAPTGTGTAGSAGSAGYTTTVYPT
jgi:hypothetical protein